MQLQYELTPRKTGTDADMIRTTGRGVPIALVSLPLRYMHAPVETASLRDIEQEIELLVDMIVHLSGSENLNPIHDEL
jgi:endoglucanase